MGLTVVIPSAGRPDRPAPRDALVDRSASGLTACNPPDHPSRLVYQCRAGGRSARCPEQVKQLARRELFRVI